MTNDKPTNGVGGVKRPTQPMRDDEQDHGPSVADDVLDEVFAEAHPNPGRVGCPSRDVLRELALKQRPIDDPGYLHLSECSPCWVEFRAAQKATATVAHARASAAMKMAAAAAMVLLVGTGAWFLLWARGDNRGPGNVPSQSTTATAVATTLDLRPYALQRSEQNPAAQQPLRLTRDLVRATILLPVGSEPGVYALQVIDAHKNTRASTTGHAVIRDFVTTLEADLDLRTLTPGAFQLGIRGQDEDWRFFEVQIAQRGQP